MRAVFTEQDVPIAGELIVPTGAIVTASARETAAKRGVAIREVAAAVYRGGVDPDA